MNETPIQNPPVQQPPIQRRKKIILLSAVLLILVAAVFLLISYLKGDKPITIIDDTPRIENYAATVENDMPECSLTTIDYPESAFSIGVPNGWLYGVNDGTVSIMEDETNTTAALLYTAKLQKDLTTKDFLQAYSRVLIQTLEEQKSTLDIQDIQELENEVNANITVKAGEYNLKGKMSALKSGDFVTFKTYWAPVEIYEQREDILKQVCGCFARKRVITDDMLAAQNKEEVAQQLPEGFKTYKGKYFQLNMPSDFKAEERSNDKMTNIDLLKSDQRTVLMYAYTTKVEGEHTPKSWVEKLIPEMQGLTDMVITDGPVLHSHILGNNIQEFTFTGKMQGTPIAGKLTVGIYQPPHLGAAPKHSSAFWIGQLTTADKWEGVKDTLQKMQDSLTIIKEGVIRKSTLLPITTPTETTKSSTIANSKAYITSLTAESQDKWIEGIGQYEPVSSPSTGQTYNVPINSWSSLGPEGKGYYKLLPDNSLEKLQY